MKHAKHRLSSSEEFEVMKIVLDKFLWLGTFFVGWGLYSVLTSDFMTGMYRILTGAIIFFVFAWMVVREFEMIR